jgi:hypothetical protein
MEALGSEPVPGSLDFSPTILDVMGQALCFFLNIELTNVYSIHETGLRRQGHGKVT